MSEREHETFIEMVTGHEPEINVVDKDSMDERIKIVFDQISNTLQRSYGPAGAHAIISQMPSYHITKDGWTIMKNIKYNSEYGYVDYVIKGMIEDICARLNYAVGDGTTSAVLASNFMYKAFVEEKVLKQFFLPRNLINSLKRITNEISEKLMEKAIPISSMSIDEMTQYIKKIVYVSSNADKEMTNTIVDIYKEIEYPAISVVKAPDGVTKGKIASGFMFPAKLMDRLYVNNDNNTQNGQHYDVVIFDHKVGKNAYHYILKTLNYLCRMRMRKIICIAPMYDETVLQGDILNDLNKEFRQTHDINLIIMGFKCTSNYDWKRLSDFAMLCNTPIITAQVERELVDAISDHMSKNQDLDTLRCINLDYRNIPNTLVLGTREEIMKMDNPQKYIPWYEGRPGITYKDDELVVRIGYVGKVDLSMTKDSVFSNFIYDENLYQKYLSDAQKDYDDVVEKYKKLGTFTFEVDNCKKRLLSLKLKMAEIEVGASSDFSQNFAKDAMDDAVKAAESAYRNGIIIGGHVTLMKVISEMLESAIGTDELILNTMLMAFKYVHRCILENAFGPYEKYVTKLTPPEQEAMYINLKDLTNWGSARTEIEKALSGKVSIDYGTEDYSSINEFFKHLKRKYVEDTHIHVYDLITEYEIAFGVMLNFNSVAADSKLIRFDKDVINSAATDREILLAASDLIGLLITGNQLVVSNGNH